MYCRLNCPDTIAGSESDLVQALANALPGLTALTSFRYFRELGSPRRFAPRWKPFQPLCLWPNSML